MAKKNFNSIFGDFTPAGSVDDEVEDITGSSSEEFEEEEEEESEEEESKTEAEEETSEEEESEESEEDFEEEETEDDSADGFSFAPVVEGLAADGVLTFDPEVEYDDSEEGFKQIVEYTVDSRFEEKYGLPDNEHLLYLEFLKQGGTNAEWLEGQRAISYADADLTDEETQEALVEKQLQLSGMKPEKIEAKIKKLREEGRLEDEAADAQEILLEWEAKEKEKFNKQIELNQKAQEQEHLDRQKKLRSDIDSLEKLGATPLTKELKNKLYEHITKPVKNGLSQFQLNQNKKENALSVALTDMLGLTEEYTVRKATTKATGNLKKAFSKYTDPTARASGKTVKSDITTKALPSRGMPWGKQ